MLISVYLEFYFRRLLEKKNLTLFSNSVFNFEVCVNYLKITLWSHSEGPQSKGVTMKCTYSTKMLLQCQQTLFYTLRTKSKWNYLAHKYLILISSSWKPIICLSKNLQSVSLPALLSSGSWLSIKNEFLIF